MRGEARDACGLASSCIFILRRVFRTSHNLQWDAAVARLSRLGCHNTAESSTMHGVDARKGCGPILG